MCFAKSIVSCIGIASKSTGDGNWGHNLLQLGDVDPERNDLVEHPGMESHEKAEHGTLTQGKGRESGDATESRALRCRTAPQERAVRAQLRI
jgi:hypothetical protein